VDGTLDRAGYELARDKVQADLEAAEAELGHLQRARPSCALPPLVEVLRGARSWGRVLRGADLVAQRDVLAALIDRVTLVRTGWWAYAAEITWTPVGQALRGAAEAAAIEYPVQLVS
jgi:hypothetical protein